MHFRDALLLLLSSESFCVHFRDALLLLLSSESFCVGSCVWVLEVEHLET